MEEAQAQRAPVQNFADQMANLLVPVSLLGAFVVYGATRDWQRVLNLLFIDFSCGLKLSTATAISAAIAAAAKKGILVKGGNYIDVLARVGTVAFDKTGTVTHGVFDVTAVHPSELKENELLHLAAHVEHSTTHPIGAALRDAFPDEATDGCKVTDIEEVAGKGIQATIEGRKVAVGNTKMMDLVGAQWHQCEHGDHGTIIHVAIDGTYAGHIVINDEVKPDSAEAIRQLKTLGVRKTVMLTGDREAVAARVAQQLLIDEYHADDEISMANNNSSCFNFRLVAHTNRISKHGLGVAVDINPLYNPYIKTIESGLYIAPAAGRPYMDRDKEFDYKLEKDDPCYKLFVDNGFEWGGEWEDEKDYQHFEIPVKQIRKWYPDINM